MYAYINWNCDPVIFSFGSFGIRYYGLCWVLGFLFGYLAVRKIFIKEGLKIDQLNSLLFYVFIGGFVGARLGHCLFYDWKYFSHHLWEIVLPVTRIAGKLHFTGYAGLASHGGAIGVIIALILFYRKYRIPFLSLLDKIAFASAIAGAFIRIGNFFNSEILGAPTTVSWAVVFEQVGTEPRHPAQLYEAAAYLLTFVILSLVYRWKYRRGLADGGVFGLAFILIFGARFGIEFVKEVQEPFEVGLRQAVGMDMGQILSLPFILIGLVFLLRSLILRYKAVSRE